MAVRREYIADLYRNLLGREGSEDEISGHVDNPGGEQGLYDFFTGSPEYTAQHGGEATWHDEGGQVVPVAESGYQVQGEPESGTGQPGGRVEVPGGGPGSPGSGAGSTPLQWFTNPNSADAFAADRFFDPNSTDVKYEFARIASRYPSTPAGLQALVNDPEFRSKFPNARLVGHDSIDFGGALSGGRTGSPVGVIDVGQNFNSQTGTGSGWWWGHGGPSGAPAAAASGGPARTGAGNNSTVNQIQSIFQALPASNTNYSGPGGPGITNGPLQQVGQDPFSMLITNALAGLIENEGRTDLGNSVNDAITALLERGGELDPNQTARRFESARELLDKGRRTMVNDLRGDLASRNLLSEPGIPQGAEIGGINRITEHIAPEFSRALRDIYTDESAKSDARLMTSLGMAMNVSSEQARTLLAALGEGTDRQAELADIALRNLAQNQAWSQFLANFGLERDQVMYAIQNGQIESILPILQAFLQLSGMANQGYVGAN
jgi:hypothetical protein